MGLAIAAFAMLCGVSCQKSPSGVQAAGENPAGMTAQKILSMDDQNFLIAADKSQLIQRDLAQAAVDKSKNGDVVEFAHRVIDERKASLAELGQLMKTKQISEPAAIAEDLQLETKNALQSLSDDAFDHEIVSLIAAELGPALTSFNSASQTAADPDVRNYARAILPSIQRDADQAVALEKKLAAKNQK
jgi:putative membrane protein